MTGAEACVALTLRQAVHDESLQLGYVAGLGMTLPAACQPQDHRLLLNTPASLLPAGCLLNGSQ